MKRITFYIMLLAALLLLTGCGSTEPVQDPHPDWDEAWFRVSTDVGVETPSGFVFNESNDVMSPDGLYYATWTSGEGRDITNAQGREAVVYDAQIYVLVKVCDDKAEAEADVSEWMAREKSSYETTPETELTAAGQAFRVLPLIKGSEDNPYGRGVAAFAVRENTAITVELLCADAWTGDLESTLEAFLNGFHYGN